MGFFDDGISIISGKTSHGHGRTKHLKLRRRSRSRSRSGSRDRHRHHDHRPVDTMSVVGSVLGVDKVVDRVMHHRRHRSHSPASRGFWPWIGLGRHRSGFFGFCQFFILLLPSKKANTHTILAAPSYFRRSSRHGFLRRSLRKVKHLLRDLSHYATRHPLKVFMLVIVPLLTTGALTALLARFGLRLPRSVERLLGLAGKVAVGDSFGLVGEAVRMAGNVSGSGSVHVERGRRVDGRGDFGWERSVVDSDSGWGGGIYNIAKRFL